MRTQLFVLAGLGLAVAACTIDAPTFFEGDAGGDAGVTIDAPIDAPSGYRVGGEVDGLWQPAGVSLRMLADGVDEILSITENGTFEFSGYLPADSSYTVTIQTQPTQHECVVFGGTGIVLAEDLRPIRVACVGPIAVDVSMSVPLSFVFDPARSRSEIETSLLTQEFMVVVDAPMADVIRVDDVSYDSGAQSAPILVGPGENEIKISVVAGIFSRDWFLVLRRGAIGLVQSSYLGGSSRDGGDHFGSSLDADLGHYAASSPGEDGSGTGVNPSLDEAAEDSGAVFASAGVGFANLYLKSLNTVPHDRFGEDIAIDGDTLVVGSPSDSGTGVAYVFRWDGTGWEPEAQLRATNADVGDSFGVSVAIDGDVVVVGANGESSGATGVNGDSVDNSVSAAGAAYVFRRIGTKWMQEAYLKASNTDADQFGLAVAVSADLVAVGTYFEDSAAQGINGDQADNSANSAGAVYVFKKSGNLWSQDAYIKASNAQANDRFGFSVALSAGRLAVGAPEEDGFDTGVNGVESDNSAPGSGAVYVFARSITGWAQEAYVKASNTGAGDGFGSALALRGDLLLVGASSEQGGGQGIDPDGDNNSAQSSGAAYLFHRDLVQWGQSSYIKASNAEANDTFGWDVALSGYHAFIGAPYEDGEDDSSNDSGSVYVFR